MGQTLINQETAAVKCVDPKGSLEGVDVLFVFGVGDASLYRTLSSWLKKAESRYLVFIEEQEELVLKAKELPFAKDPKVRLFFHQRGEEEIFSHLCWDFVFLRFGYAVQGEEENAESFFRQLDHTHRGIDLLASDCEDMGVKVLTNALKNLQMLPSARLGPSVEGKCAGIPAIVCGAGPSLNAALPLLATLKERALLIAGGSAVRALTAHGIAPHLQAHIDPQPPRRRFLEQDSFEVPVFYQGRFCSALLSLTQGPLFWMPDSGSYPLEGWLAAECGIFSERFDAGWTVANFCTAIAAHLGCSPIIFVGMDFSCGPDVIYASDIAGEENRNELIEIEKGALYSKRDWLMSAEWIASYARERESVEWINASSKGISLGGIPKRDLQEVAKTSLTNQRDMQGMMHALWADAAVSHVTFEKVADVRRRVKESFEKSLELCDGLLKVFEKYYPHSPLEKGEYAVLELELEQEVCHSHFLLPLWNVWKRPILRASFHPIGQHLHKLLFFKKAIEVHLPSLRSFI